MPFRLSASLATGILVSAAAVASGQTIHVGDEAALRSAIATAPAGATIVLDANVTLSADLPSVSNNLTIDGGGHTLSGGNQFRGLFIAALDVNQIPTPINVTVQNLTIANTVAAGGNGGDGSAGGGGGAGLGGAIFVGSAAGVTVTNVNVVSSSAIGGNGGNTNGDPSGGAGGGLGGNGASALGSGAGGGGIGRGATGGDENTSNGGAGILTGGAPGGDTSPTSTNTGGVSGGGGGGGAFGGAGGGSGGGSGGLGNGGSGGFGGGGGGAGPGFSAPNFSGSGGFGGGGGGGDAPGFGGFGAGGGGGTINTTFGGFNSGQFGGAGADGTTASGGGGGAGLGGGIFVADSGTLTIGGGFTINGTAVQGGTGGAGAENGQAFGSGFYLQGSGVIGFNQAAGQTATISTDIADEGGALGSGCLDCAPPGRWGVDKQGAGTLALTGNNIYTGGTVVEGGTLQINTAQNIGSGDVGLMNGTTLAIRGTSTFANGLFLDGTGTMSVAAGQQTTWNGIIADLTNPGTLAVTGGGTLSLGNTSNSYTGGTVVAGNSTLQIGADAVLGTGSVTLGDSASKGTLSVSSGSVFTMNRSMTLGLGGGVIDTAGTADLTTASSISGGGSLTKVGTGTLTFGAVNTYTGGTDVEQGTVRTSVANAFNTQGLVNVASGATLDLNSFNQTIGGLTGAGSVTLGSGTLATGGSGASTAFDGILSGTGGLVKDGAGTLVLTGANTYTGGTTVNGGALIGNTTSLQGNIANNALVVFSQNTNGTFGGQMTGTGALAYIGAGTLSLNGANTYSGGTTILGGTISIGADSALGSANGGVALGDSTTKGTLSFRTGSVFSSIRPFVFGAGGAILDTAGSSSITLNGALSGAGLTKMGTGALTLGAVNTYTGGTDIEQGTLRTSIANAFNTQGLVNVASGATLDLNNFNQTISGLTGAGSVTLGTGTLSTGGSGASTAFGGVISGAGGLVKNGAGTLVLTGANTYTGGTTVNGGALIGNTTSVQGNIANNALVVFSQNTNGTFGGQMTGTGSLTYIGAGTLSLNAGNSYSGGTSVLGGGTISIGADSALGSANGGVALGDSTTTGTLSFRTGSAFSSNRSFVFGAGGAFFDTAGDSSITLNGALSGVSGLTKIGTGTLTLGGSSSYAGPTSILAGSLRTGASNVLNANGALTLATGTSLDLSGFNQTVASLAGSGSLALGSGTLTTGADGSSTTFSGPISGTGRLVKLGGGTFSLQGANTYTGGTTVSGGTLLGNTTSIQGDILNNSVVMFDQNPDGTYSGSMSGTGALAKLGAGVLTLTGTNTYTGGTIIDGGSVIGTGASLQGTIVNNASLTFGGNADTAFHGLLAGTGGLIKTGTGTLTLNGANPTTGTFTVNQGTLAVNGLFGGSVNVGPGATLKASGFIAGPINLAGSLFVVPPAGAASTQQVVSSGSSPRLDVPPSLVVGSNLTAIPGSLIDFTIGPGVNPTLQVGGAASLNGTHFSVTTPSIGTARSASFLAVTAANLTMQNTDVVSADPTIIPLLKQDKNALFVTVINLNVPLATGIDDPNRRGVANAIDRIKFGAGGDGATVIHELTALDDKGLNDALTQIEGQIHASAIQAAVLDADTFTDFAKTQAAQGREIGEVGRMHWWTQFNCQHANYKGTSAAQGGSSDVCAGAGGADHNFNEHWMVGGGGGFGKGTLGLGAGLGSSDYHAPRAFGYGGWQPKNFGIRFGGSASKSSYKTQRQIQFAATLPQDLGGEALTGGVDRQAQSTQQGTSSDQWSELHDSRKVGTYTFEGLVGIRHARFSRQGWSETGADSLSLEGQADQSLTLNETDIKISGYRRSGTFRPFFETFYRHELSNAQTLTELSFAGAANSNFQIAGLPVPGNTYSGKIGASMMLRFAGQLTAEYSFLRSAAETRQSVGLRFRFK